jgi:hypothetical protein
MNLRDRDPKPLYHQLGNRPPSGVRFKRSGALEAATQLGLGRD